MPKNENYHGREKLTEIDGSTAFQHFEENQKTFLERRNASLACAVGFLLSDRTELPMPTKRAYRHNRTLEEYLCIRSEK
jgi:hypothetical protein